MDFYSDSEARPPRRLTEAAELKALRQKVAQLERQLLAAQAAAHYQRTDHRFGYLQASGLYGLASKALPRKRIIPGLGSAYQPLAARHRAPGSWPASSNSQL